MKEKLEEIGLDNIDQILADIEETQRENKPKGKANNNPMEQHLNEDDLLILQELENEKDID